ncbi:DNA polymerase/3'-5' exonuclease PolX [Methanolobus halotolerans]|uniref:DNA polymerase beta n=1 Tax=Methanolobus halotolerans TaxID=2052935 RepID=A0A4E0PWG8_9EURY|nr:DNA polymerase/3'-5' exonuclease PolX [Methanolobus halotolerans]TGC09721.1 DNA polymerase III [Methanolobus halotolerans]
MNNTKVAAFLNRMASLLEFKGENPYKIKAYQRAARNIKVLDEDLSSLYEKGRISEIPGVGEAIRDKVIEILTKGTFEAYEETIAEIPPGVLDIMDIPGIGPKTAKLFHEKLDIGSIEELVRAAEEHRIRRLARMGPRQEEKIIRSVQRHLKSSDSGRTPLAVASPIADQIKEQLNTCPYIREIIAAGSLRRRKETVKNIDLLALSDDPQAAADAFLDLKSVTDVIEKGESLISIIYKGMIRVDLRIIPKGSFGPSLQHFTGSKEHNVHLRKLALSKGYRLSEYGFADTETNTLKTCESEKEVYDFLGLGYPVPELREDRGEIEAGMEKALPGLIDMKDIKGDLHVHSNWSDGKNSIEELAVAALEKGYEYVAITDHSHSTAIASGLSDKKLLEHARDVDRVNEKIEGIRLLSGTECDIRSNGKLDYSNEVLESLDIVIVAVHAALEQDRKTMTKRIVTALENEHVDILAHPTGRKFGKRGAYDVDMEKVFQTALDNDKILEINSSPARLDLNDINARIAKNLGIKLAISTDTHKLDNFNNIRYGIDVARRAWVEPQDVVNTRKLKEISSLLGIR